MTSITTEKMVVTHAEEREKGRRAAEMTFPTVDATVRVTLFPDKCQGPEEEGREWLTTGNIHSALISSARYCILVILQE
jgi:hypothetical protein